MYYIASFDDDEYDPYYNMPTATNYTFEENDPLMEHVDWKEKRWRSIWDIK